MDVSVVRSRRLATRAWWALLPFSGVWGYRDVGEGPWWTPFAVVPYLLWRLVSRLPGSDPFEPMEEIVCTCDWCRGVPGARFEP